MLSEAQRLVETRSKAEGIEQADFRFSRRELREASGWSQTQVGVHLRRLEELEYVLVHPGPGRRRLYELCIYDPVSTGPEPSLTGGDRGIDVCTRPSAPPSRGLTGDGARSGAHRRTRLVGALDDAAAIQSSANSVNLGTFNRGTRAWGWRASHAAGMSSGSCVATVIPRARRGSRSAR